MGSDTPPPLCPAFWARTASPFGPHSGDPVEGRVCRGFADPTALFSPGPGEVKREAAAARVGGNPSWRPPLAAVRVRGSRPSLGSLVNQGVLVIRTFVMLWVALFFSVAALVALLFGGDWLENEIGTGLL